MRTPQNALPALLAGALGGALVALLGGTGGLAVRLRALKMRVDAHDDELDSFGRRVSRREGAAGRAAQGAQTELLRGEAAKILEAAKAKPRNGAPHVGGKDGQLLTWVNSVFGGAEASDD